MFFPSFILYFFESHQACPPARKTRPKRSRLKSEIANFGANSFSYIISYYTSISQQDFDIFLSILRFFTDCTIFPMHKKLFLSILSTNFSQKNHFFYLISIQTSTNQKSAVFYLLKTAKQTKKREIPAFLSKSFQVVRRRLIDEIIEPIYKQKASVRSPTNDRLVIGIVTAVIVHGRLDR